MLRGNEVSVSLVPVMMLHGKVLRRHEFGVKHTLTCPVFLVADIDSLENCISELLVFIVRVYLNSEKLSCVSKPVNTDGKLLFLHIDESG